MVNRVRIVTDSEGRTRIFINGAEIFHITYFSLEQEGGVNMFPSLRLDISSVDSDFEYEGKAITTFFIDEPPG